MLMRTMMKGMTTSATTFQHVLTVPTCTIVQLKKCAQIIWRLTTCHADSFGEVACVCDLLSRQESHFLVPMVADIAAHVDVLWHCMPVEELECK